MTELNGVPHYSPANRRFVVLRDCASSQVQIEIWHVEGDGAMREASIACPFRDRSLATSVRWTSEDRIEFRLRTVMETDESAITRAATLLRDAGNWRFR